MAAGANELFAGDGVARRARAIDWAATSLGPVESWPAALRTSVRTVLDAPVPMAVWSGPELIGIYNDAYCSLLGERDPAALGRPYREVWAEIWADAGPMFQQVREGGPPISATDAPFFLHQDDEPEARANGEPNAWFTFSLSGIRDERGEIIGFLNIAIDTTRRVLAEREREAALAEAAALEARLRDMFVQAPAFMAVLRGPKHVFEFANEAYYQLVGHRALIGRALVDALPEVRGQGFEEVLTQVYTSGTPFVGKEIPVNVSRLPGQAPEQRFVDFIYYPIRDSDGAPTGVVGHGYDVTEHVLLRQEAQQARAQADDANHAKSQFLANMSHEIRTPINAIVGYADLMDAGIGGPLSDTQENYVRRIRNSSRHLLTLVNDVLDLSKVEAGEMRVERRATLIEPVLDAATQMIAPQATARNISLRREGVCAGHNFLGDEARARQIVLNLLSNAVKFTEPGGEVIVRCDVPDVGAEQDGESWVVVEVEDTGRGIPETELERIFEPFAQGGLQADRQRVGGTGLGLTISRKLAQLMGGDLTVESTVGVGSRFTLRLARALPGRTDGANAWLRSAEWPAAPGVVPGLGVYGQTLVERAEPLENELVMRLSSDGELPTEERTELADHAATYFSTLGKLLIHLDQHGGDPSARDSEEILSVVTDRHGKQRRRLGWSRPDIEREYEVLHSLLDSFFRNEAAVRAGADVDPTLGVVHRLLDRGETGSIAAFEEKGVHE